MAKRCGLKRGVCGLTAHTLTTASLRSLSGSGGNGVYHGISHSLAQNIVLTHDHMHTHASRKGKSQSQVTHLSGCQKQTYETCDDSHIVLCPPGSCVCSICGRESEREFHMTK